MAHTYALEELTHVPSSAISRALGVANHLRYADVQPGETVLDIGCGGGIDTIIAARRTGPEGTVIGLDFLPEMLERTRLAASEAGLDNIQIRGHVRHAAAGLADRGFCCPHGPRALAFYDADLSAPQRTCLPNRVYDQ